MKKRPVSRRKRRRSLAPLVWLGVVVAAAMVAVSVRGRQKIPAAEPPMPSTPRYLFHIVHAYPHDAQAFTQGLFFRDGYLFESTGLNGRSSVRKVRLETGEVIQQRSVDEQYFAEGLVDWGDHLIQLTWRSGIGFVYDLNSFTLTRTFPYRGEGWGIARDAVRLIASDGSSTLRFLDPESLAEIGRLDVTENGRPVDNLNELEVVKGEIYANVWQTSEIAIINARSGQVAGRIDLAGLLAPSERAGVDVLNGIAYDAAKDRLFVTGKWWPKLFEITLDPKR